MAILKFRVYWEEDESVYRDIAIPHTYSFLKLHEAILKAFEFDNKHQATFYRSNDAWQRGREISVEKYDKEYRAEPLIMSEVAIGDEVKDPNQKFCYDYDFNKNWKFLVELIQVNKGTDSSDLSYPVCVRVEGMAPTQYGAKGLVDKRLAEMEEKYDLKSTALDDGFSSEGEDDAENTEEAGEDDNNDELL